MNIFYLEHDVKNCAKLHVDRHCVKMILEYAMLLSTAHRILDGIPSAGVSKKGRKQTQYTILDSRESSLCYVTHINHPSNIWVRQSRANYDWLFRMFVALMDEYTYRYGKVHVYHRLIEDLSHPPKNIPEGSFTEPTPAMPPQYKVAGDSIKSYKNYYLGDKRHLFSWKLREVPPWCVDEAILIPR